MICADPVRDYSVVFNNTVNNIRRKVSELTWKTNHR